VTRPRGDHGELLALPQEAESWSPLYPEPPPLVNTGEGVLADPRPHDNVLERAERSDLLAALGTVELEGGRGAARREVVVLLERAEAKPGPVLEVREGDLGRDHCALLLEAR